VVVTTKGRFDKYNRTYVTKNESMDEEIPVVILVNKRSASASEILSGALQDYDRAVIIGDTTYGKGLVQRTYPLKYGTYMKQTISKYYIPSGRLIQKIDYWHRDSKGNPLLMSKNLPEKDYQTTNGRTVHNLGGVIPDIVLDPTPKESLLSDLKQQNILFDFATWYYYHQPKPTDINTFQLTDKDFDLFLKYLTKNKLKPKSNAEKILENAYKKAQKESQDVSILQSYKEVLKAYQKSDQQSLIHNKAYIIDQLYRDLNNRYFGKKGLYQYLLTHDPVILKAQDILHNTKQYNRILKK